jgi:hypothetical protein
VPIIDADEHPAAQHRSICLPGEGPRPAVESLTAAIGPPSALYSGELDWHRGVVQVVRAAPGRVDLLDQAMRAERERAHERARAQPAAGRPAEPCSSGMGDGKRRPHRGDFAQQIGLSTLTAGADRGDNRVARVIALVLVCNDLGGEAGLEAVWKVFAAPVRRWLWVGAGRHR